MRVEDYRKHDAISLAGLVAEGEVSAEEVLEAMLFWAGRQSRRSARGYQYDRRVAETVLFGRQVGNDGQSDPRHNRRCYDRGVCIPWISIQPSQRKIGHYFPLA